MGYDLSNVDKPTIKKDPDAALDYSWDWSAWLAGAGADAIGTFQVIVQAPLVLVSSNQVGGVVTAFISGGVAGNTYTATCRINTVAGRTEDRTIYLQVIDR